MPSRKLHNILTKVLLRDSFSWVSEYIDRPFAKYRGRHRQLRHDTAMIIRMLEEHGIRAALAAWLHLTLDDDRRLKDDVERVETLRELKDFKDLSLRDSGGR